MAEVNLENNGSADEAMNDAVHDENALDTDEEGGFRVDDDVYIPPPLYRIGKVDTSGPRLMITKIVCENFKSYAGTQVIGPFHQCFSAIVGPNGSGKSNVIDSMLFVFGYRASKIRSKKISVLIHNSSEHPNAAKCTVSVHFQRVIDKAGATYDVVQNSEFVISRTASKDNSSYYELDNRKVQFKEIAKLLRSYCVDLDHNRFLILQGEVEQIAMMKPKGQNENDIGMLEFLEDIIGTVRYKEPLEKLSEKVELLTECREEKLIRLRVVEQEKTALQEPMQEAVQYLRMENAVTKIENQFYQCKRAALVRETRELGMRVTELEKDLTDLIDELKTVEKKKEEINSTVKEKSSKWNGLQTQKENCATRFDEIRKRDEALHAELVETNKRRQSNVTSLKSERAKLEELLKVPESSARDIKECEKLLVTQEALKGKEEAALSDLMGTLKEKAEPLMTERSKLETKLILLRDKVDRAKSDHEIARSELELYTSVERAEREKLENLRRSLESTVATVNERRSQLVSFETKIPATEVSLREARDELDGVRAREAEATARLKGMRLIFEEERCAMQASRSRSKILNSLMREKADGRLAGIFGRLGDLGAIDSKYDVAVSTACGPLDNIVVDTVNTAQACITFLRENDIGRATFIPLDKQQRFLSKCREPIDTPENVPRLFDLIKVDDERLLTAFYYALQDTLVARDLEQATRIAYGAKRYRVVTMMGELIELSGTMSGGGRIVFKGRMGQKVVRNEPSTADVERLQAELDAVYNECGRLKVKREQLENQVDTLSAALKEMRAARDKYRIEVGALDEQEPLLRKQLKAQECKVADSASNPAKVRDMTVAVEEAAKRMEEAERQSKSLERDVDRVNKRIEEISGNRVKEQQGKISSAAKLVEKTRGEICRLQVAVKTAERNARKAEQRIETLENDVKSCEERIREVQGEKDGIEGQAKDLLNEINRLTEALAERDECLASLKAELSEVQARETKLNTVKIDLDQKLNESGRKLLELKHRTGEYTKRISRLELRPVPGEEIDELKEFTDDEIVGLDEKALATSLDKAKKKLPSDVPNMRIISDYREKDALYLQRAADLEVITSQRNKVRGAYETVRQRRVQEFLDGFTLITGKLKEMYQMITLGGDAELELVDSLDPFSEGVAFSVRPPKKTWKNISSLSGGEKTLSSLALVFALHHYKPTPLYFMDEIDAALDFKNVSIVANYIKERTKNAQFIVISLRSNMFELADYLVGIYKTYNCSKCATVNVSKFYEKCGIAPPTQVMTSKTHAYGSQSQRPFSQLVRTGATTVAATVATTVATTVAPLTCPPRLERPDDVPSAATIIASPPPSPATSPLPTSDEIGLPDLGLCPTPLKLPPVANGSSAESGERKDREGEGKKQLRKRRKA